MAILAIYHQSSSTEFVSRVDEVDENLVLNEADSKPDEVLTWLQTLPLQHRKLELIVTNCPDSALISSVIRQLQLPVYIADSFSPKECYPEAKITGTPLFCHSCSVDGWLFKYLARQEAQAKNLELKDSAFIVAQLGASIQMGALVGTDIVDALSSKDEGPFSLSEAGGLPFDRLLDLCIAAKGREATLDILQNKSGLTGYLGTQTLQEFAEDRSEQGQFYLQALAYQVAKETGALATVLKGKVDSIIVTGELANNEALVAELNRRIQFLGGITLYPGNRCIGALFADAEHRRDQETVLGSN